MRRREWGVGEGEEGAGLVKARQLAVRDASERDEGDRGERGLERAINAMFTCRPPPQFKEKER